MKIKGTFLNDKETKSVNYFLTLLVKDMDNMIKHEENEETKINVATLKKWANHINQIINQ
jgi:hypothetical protein